MQSIFSLFGSSHPAPKSALAQARTLAAHLPSRHNCSTSGGELESHEFWSGNARLLEEARQELGPLHPALYDLEANEQEFIRAEVRSAVRACERAAAAGERVDEAVIKSLITPTDALNVWRLPLFSQKFCTLLLEELHHYETSGLPLRRPNGMNRYGAILDELGMKSSLDYLSRRYLRPLGQMLFPWLIANGDADEHYAFVVKYKRGDDVELAEHADASVLTLNAFLGLSGFRGGRLAFRGTRWVDANPQAVPQSFVDFEAFAPGDAILHLGGQYHAALPIVDGERANMVVWLSGKHQAVRLAPHDSKDQLSAQQRWDAYAEETAALACKPLESRAVESPED